MKKNNDINNKNRKKNNNQIQVNKKNKVSNKERSLFYNMNQIEWFPIDPYCD